MSHTTSIKAVKIQSVGALQSAITELAASGIRVSLIPNATPRAYFANQQGMGKADFVVKLEDAAYDIGLYKQADGSYEARTDFYNPAGRGGASVESILGATATKAEYAQQAKMGKLFQMYGVHAATEAARKKGHSVRRVTGADGTIKLELTGTSL